jgi:hypothetical protein
LASKPEEREFPCLRREFLREYLDIRYRSNRRSLTRKYERRRLFGKPPCRWKIKQMGLDKT